MSQKRIIVLDGLRGLAITLVVLYHTFSRHRELIPWASNYYNLPIFRLGFLGVQLFFLISGFVVYMSLENSTSFKQFIFKRWLRLFPAMLLATLLIYFSASFFFERPKGIPNIENILPGLLFIDPVWLSQLLSKNIDPLEGSFWSLFVEVKFYFIFGISYFYFRSKAIYFLAFLFFIAVFIEIAKHFNIHSYGLYFLNTMDETFVNFGWFAAGAWFYQSRKTLNRDHLLMSILLGTLSSFYMGMHIYYKGYGSGYGLATAAFLIYAIFILSFQVKLLVAIFSSKILVFMGFISYPLYLIHESIIVSSSIKVHNTFPKLPGIWTPTIPLLMLCFAAWVLASYAEPKFRRLINNITRSFWLLAKRV